MLMWRFVLSIFCFGLIVPGITSGQDYPNKPIRIVVPPVGGGSDFVARQIAQSISGPLGQPVIVENRIVILAIETASKAPPDGYTLAVQGGVLWIYPLLYKASYDPVRDFSPLSLISREVFIVAVHPSVPAKSVSDLIALAKARPGQLNWGSPGTGGSQQLATELFRSMAGINIVRIPYKGSAPAITDLLSGELQLLINDTGLLAPHAKSGRLRALAVTSAEPSALAPGLPTVTASGLPGYEAVSMTGIFAPAKTPGAIISRLNEEIVRAVNRADVKENLFKAGAEVVGSSPEQFVAIIKSEIAKMGKVIKDAGIKAD